MCQSARAVQLQRRCRGLIPSRAGALLFVSTFVALLAAPHAFAECKFNELGGGFGHIALELEDAAKACDNVRRHGGAVTREAGPVKGGTTVIAFVQDPDGYKIEFIEHKRAA